MELALFVYLAGVVGSINGFMIFVTILAFIATGLYTVAVADAGKFKEANRLILALPFMIGIITNLIPSEKTMYLMLAGYTSQQVLQSETGNKVVKVINAKLDDYLEEVTKTKEKK